MKFFVCIAFIVVALIGSIYHAHVRTLTRELDTVKSQLAAEVAQREHLERLRVEMDKSAEERRKDSDAFRKKLEGADDEILDGVVPDAVLRGLRSVKDNIGADSKGSH